MRIINAQKGTISITSHGRDWTLFRPSDLESLWNALGADEFGEDERIPYWTELWPASLALAEWLYEKSTAINHARCVDMGCGLGLTAMLGAALGAHVLAFDYEPDALKYACKNMRFNQNNAIRQTTGFNPVLWSVMDWRKPALTAQSAQYIWAGDIMYERRFIEPVAAFLEHALHPKGTVWIAEPGRNIYKDFQAYLFRAGWDARQVKNIDAPSFTASNATVQVQIWEMKKIIEK